MNTAAAQITGEGTLLIFAFIALLVIILAAVIAWQLWKKSREAYTLAYASK
jgi:cbb3-type cytochrome oxidase subunit 3